MIHLNNISFFYQQSKAVFENFSWRVESGETWAVLGPSGCGKSTLLYLLAGLKRPNKGTVSILNQLLDRPRPRTGLILQDYGLLPWATVFENVALGLRIRGFYGPDGKHAPTDEIVSSIEASVSYWLERLDMVNLSKQYPSQISGGQRQRVAIARTLVMKPDLLLMDEPFASLDAPTRDSFQKLLIQLHKEHGLTEVVVTHSIEEAAILGKKILVLGKLPNRIIKAYDNPNGGEDGYPDSKEYYVMCAKLRAVLEDANL